MDMMMPELDGYRAIPALKQEFEVPVIAVTAQAMLGDREKCLEAGADDYMPKPVDVDRLLRLLDKFLK
jgi:CheY-like chemotaxis protein